MRNVAAFVLMFTSAWSCYASGWQYKTETDRMTGREVKMAYLRSENSLNLRFPYNGPNHGWVIVRERDGKREVAFKVDKGQVLCNVLSCEIRVRFGDAPPVSFSGVGPADYSTETAFIEQSGRFIAAAQKATRILVQLPMFQAGTQTLEFSSPYALERSTSPARKK